MVMSDISVELSTEWLYVTAAVGSHVTLGGTGVGGVPGVSPEIVEVVDELSSVACGSGVVAATGAGVGASVGATVPPAAVGAAAAGAAAGAATGAATGAGEGGAVVAVVAPAPASTTSKASAVHDSGRESEEVAVEVEAVFFTWSLNCPGVVEDGMRTS